jgi:hypothetical protein
MPDVVAQLLVIGGLLAAALFMWWFTPRFIDWITPGEPLWMIWIQKVCAAAVFATPAAYVIVSALR